MRLITPLLLTILLLGLTGCDTTQKRVASSADTASVTEPNEDRAVAKQQFATRSESTSSQNVSLTQADSANAASQAAVRKIIRNGNLTIEVSSPTETQSKIFSIAEARGGFVVTSEMSQQTTDDKSKPTQSVTLVVRVPALQFEQAMTEIRTAATRVLQDKRTGQDVTEEFIDLEARIKNQRALEGQFLEIMKRAPARLRRLWMSSGSWQKCEPKSRRSKAGDGFSKIKRLFLQSTLRCKHRRR